MPQCWLRQLQHVGASSPNVPWNFESGGTRCYERDGERDRNNFWQSAKVTEKIRRLLVYHHLKTIVISNKETTIDHDQNIEWVRERSISAALGLIKDQVVLPGGQNSLGRREGTRMSWSIWIAAECSVFLSFSHLSWKESYDFYIATGQRKLGLGLTSHGFGWSYLIPCFKNASLPASQQPCGGWTLTPHLKHQTQVPKGNLREG